MKNRFFTLMLSGAILTTNPLWAMDLAEPDAEREAAHKCPSCHPELQFSNMDRNVGMGFLAVIPDDALAKIISLLPLEDVVNNVSLLSKTIHNLCQTPSIWFDLGGNNEENLCPKHFIKQLSFLFKHIPNQSETTPISNIFYTLTCSQLKHIIESGVLDENNDMSNQKKYIFKIGNTPFCFLTHNNEHNNRGLNITSWNKEGATKTLELIDKKQKISFWLSKAHLLNGTPTYFLSNIEVCQDSNKYEDLDSQEHDEHRRKQFYAGKTLNMTECFIRRIETTKEPEKQ